jgi:hypothetical protein
MLLLYAFTLFTSALLLFLVQPLIGKRVVPLLGGSPAVWNTCMLFFQALLLAGYSYAHLTTSRLGPRKQAVLHLAVLFVPFLVLPLGLRAEFVPSGEGHPVLGLLLLLLVTVGLPFFVVATTAPLLQRWFADTDHPAARDPYFLYSASNVGSMLALVAYPLLVEPNLTLRQQELAWTVGYGLLVLLTAGCAVVLWREDRSLSAVKEVAVPLPLEDQVESSSPGWRGFWRDLAGPSLAVGPAEMDRDTLTAGRVVRWVALAFVPSSLMLGVTTYITTDIAAIPLLWVLPLALYLLSFILTFARMPDWAHKLNVLVMPVVLLLLLFVMISRVDARIWAIILAHLLTLFAVAMVCHGELARTRPTPRWLTTYYLLLSLGGVLGGLFNAVLAPLLFQTLAEYPLVLILAGLLLPRWSDSHSSLRRRLYGLVLLMLVAVVTVEFYQGFPVSRRLLGSHASTLVVELNALGRRLHIPEGLFQLILAYAPPLALSYFLVERPMRFGLALALIFLVNSVPEWSRDDVRYRARSFFGVLKVTQDGDFLALIHGNIRHGMQSTRLRDQTIASLATPLASAGPLEASIYLAGGDLVWYEPAREPLTYYYRTGPIGQLMAASREKHPRLEVGVIGLGTGTMAAYGEPGDRLTFYEIDRKVKEISFDRSDLFTYVTGARARGAQVDLVLGDARLQLDRERDTQPDQKYDLILVDAFSSDAIPVHLLTEEALGIYLDRLKDDGIVAFHTSNRYVSLDRVVGNLAAATGCVALMQSDFDQSAPGKYASSWVLVARRHSHFGKLREHEELSEADPRRWVRLQNDPSVDLWRDDFSNLLSVFDWSAR